MNASTVLGPVAGEALGVVLPHEHVFFDLRPRFSAPPGVPAALTDEPVQLSNLSWVRYHQRNNRDNLHLSEVDLLSAELAEFRDAAAELTWGSRDAAVGPARYGDAGSTAVGTVVDLSPQCAGRDVGKLVKVAKATGLNVIAGTGYYVEEFQSAATRAATVDELAAVMVAELTTGIGETGVRAGIIGEIGCSWPLADSERRVLRAAAVAQQATGAAISVHPGRDGAAPFEIAAILAQSGADLSRVVMGHIDRTLRDHDEMARVGDLGVMLEFDLFGQESSHIRYGPVDLPTDLQRLRDMAALAARGYGPQLLASHDIALKHHLSAYGGPGYAHLITRVLPRFAEAGLSSADATAIFRENPARILSLPGGR